MDLNTYQEIVICFQALLNVFMRFLSYIIFTGRQRFALEIVFKDLDISLAYQEIKNHENTRL